MKKMNTGFSRATTVIITLCLIITIFGMHTIDIYAVGKITEAEVNSQLEIETNAQVAAVDAAKKEGVFVDSTTITTRIHGADETAIRSEIDRIKEHYAKQMADINTALASQEAYNEAFEKKQKEEFEKLISGEWAKEELAAFIGEGEKYTDAVIINKQLNEMALNPGTLVADASGKITQLRKGDMFTYENVLIDPKTDAIVDFRFTVEKIVDSSTKEEVYSTSYNNASVIKTNEISFRYGNHDLKLKIEFIRHDTKEPIFINPIIVVVDVDANQSVVINSPKVQRYLIGSNLTQSDGVIHSHDEDYSSSYKPHWALFNLIPEDGNGISEFTYTFYDDGGSNMTGVEQGLGSNALKYTTATREHAQLNIIYKNIELYYLAEYIVLPDENYGVPDDADIVADNTEYENGAVVSVQSALTTSWTTNDGTITGVPGTWSFSGWYDNSRLEGSEIASYKLNDDDARLYGKWTFNVTEEETEVETEEETEVETENDIEGNIEGDTEGGTDESKPDDKVYGIVIVKYVDEDGTVLAPSETYTGLSGEAYRTEGKIIAGAELFLVPHNAEGIFSDMEQEVIYIYKLKAVNTGDFADVNIYMELFCVSLSSIVLLVRKRRTI